MSRCICSEEWLLSYDIGKAYMKGMTLPHSAECEAEFRKSDSRDLQILEAWKWVTATESCDYPYSHQPHGNCSGRSFDRT